MFLELQVAALYQAVLESSQVTLYSSQAREAIKMERREFLIRLGAAAALASMSQVYAESITASNLLRRSRSERSRVASFIASACSR